MTANQLSTRKQKRSIDTLLANFDDVADAVDELADALDAGEADEELVAETFRQLAAASASIEDAAETAGVIDADAAEWRAINDLRASTYHTAHAIRLEGTDDDVIAPTPRSSWNAAISDATIAAERLEAARDGGDE
jgi:uncharacterized protein (DUF433 family)